MELVCEGNEVTRLASQNALSREFCVEVSKDKTLFESGDWDRLLAQSHTQTPFLHSSWLQAWSKIYGTCNPICFLSVLHCGELVAATALYDYGSHIGFAGKTGADYGDVLVHTALTKPDVDCCLAYLFDEIEAMRGTSRVILEKVPSGSVLMDYASDEYGYFLVPRDIFVTSGLSMSAADTRINKKSLKRHSNRLHRIGEVSFTTHTQSQHILPLLDEFFDMHRRRWSKQGNSSIFSNEQSKQFYRALTKELTKSGILYFSVLRLDQRMIAAHFGYVFSNHFFWYKPAFEIELAKLSPGEVLLRELMLEMKSREIEYFDFTIGEEAFKARFATAEDQVADLVLCSTRLGRDIAKTKYWLKQKLSQMDAKGIKRRAVC